MVEIISKFYFELYRYNKFSTKFEYIKRLFKN